MEGCSHLGPEGGWENWEELVRLKAGRGGSQWRGGTECPGDGLAPQGGGVWVDGHTGASRGQGRGVLLV